MIRASVRCERGAEQVRYAQRKWRDGARKQALIAAQWTCSQCGVPIRGRGAHVHHIYPLKSNPAVALVPANLKALCASCHNKVEPRGNRAKVGSRARPMFERPACRVMLVCGPVAAGKSTYVRKHAGPHDVIIDYDAIAKERGFTRDRPETSVRVILDERNRRLRSLCKLPTTATAWVILTAPSAVLRRWWMDALGVNLADLVLLTPSKEELKRRILSDSDRQLVGAEHLQLVEQWYARERANDPGYLIRGCDINGVPLDPLHPWNLYNNRVSS